MPHLRTLLLLAGLLGVVSPVAAHADQKADDIDRMMSLGGGNISAVESRLTASLSPIVQRFAVAHPNIPPDALATLRAQVHQQEMDLYQAIVVQVRARYYADMTDDEVRAILAFYGTPAGQAVLRENTVISSLVANDVTLMVPALITALRSDFVAALKRQTPPPQPG
jgi:hypothetical protein